jgi:hypothetical protein
VAWIDGEPRLSQVVREVAQRALRRPVRSVGLALLLTAAAVGYRVRKPPTYEATMYFRMQEGQLGGAAGTPRPPREIAEYIENVALSRKVLGEIMTRHSLGGAFLAHDPVAAIASFRDDVDVTVSGNYFIYDRTSDDEPRSAEFSIAYHHRDREVALAVVHEIGATILAEEAARRSAHVDQARALYAAMVQQKRTEIAGVQADLDRLSSQRTGADAIAVAAQSSALSTHIKAALNDLQGLERRQAEIELARGLDESKLGLFFELVDEEVTVIAPRLSTRQMARFAGVLFPIMAVLALALVGTLDRRVYTTRDLAARRLPAFGALPRFPGDAVGSYHARTQRRSRV